MAGHKRSTRAPGPWRLDQPPPRGNTFSLVHGGDSPRTIEARAAEARTALLDICPWLDEPAYAPAVARFLRAEARALLLHGHIAATAREKGVGAVASRLWEQATAADRLAAQLGNVLGLDPLGRARLQSLTAGAEVAVASLASLAAEGRAIREAAGEAAAVTAGETPYGAVTALEPPGAPTLPAGGSRPDTGDGAP